MDAVSLFGPDGYYVYFRILEIMADEFDIENPGQNTFLIKTLRKKLQTSLQKTLKILQFFAKKKRIFWQISGNGKSKTIRLNCPKLKDLCDEFTQRMLKKKSGVGPDVNRESLQPIEVEVEVEVDIKKKNIVHEDENEEFYETAKGKKLKGAALERFKEFWRAFNYQKGRAPACDAWLKIEKTITEEIFQKIIVGAENTAQDRPELIAKGSTPKMAQGWLNDKRWEDETGEPQESEAYKRLKASRAAGETPNRPKYQKD